MIYTMMPAAAIVDVDGTLVDVSSVRHHLERPKRNFDLFHESSAGCPPIAMTLSWVEEMHDAGHHILVVTARMEKWRNLTSAWLGRHLTRPATELVTAATATTAPTAPSSERSTPSWQTGTTSARRSTTTQMWSSFGKSWASRSPWFPAGRADAAGSGSHHRGRG